MVADGRKKLVEQIAVCGVDIVRLNPAADFAAWRCLPKGALFVHDFQIHRQSQIFMNILQQHRRPAFKPSSGEPGRPVFSVDRRAQMTVQFSMELVSLQRRRNSRVIF